MNISENVLAHYGVRGMKWGVRRKGGTPKTGDKTTYKKPPKNLSEAELKRRIQRMQLEKTYKDLNSPPPTRGKQYTNQLLESSGKQVVGAIVGSVATFAVQRALKAKFGN